MNSISLPQFEGPLDALLAMIEAEQLPLTDVALSHVTEQFMNYIRTLPGERAVETADFLVVATKLLYLKSKALLPYLMPEESEGPTLAEQLRLYRSYVEASKVVLELYERHLRAYGRIEPPLKLEGFFLPHNASGAHMERAYRSLLKRLQPLKPLPQVAVDRTISLKEKIESLYRALQSVSSLSLHEMLAQAASRTEVIVTFLAVLELAKERRVELIQEAIFEDVRVRVAGS